MIADTPIPPALAALSASRRPPRVVIDTASVMSALMFGGEQLTRLRRAWRHGYCRPLVCKATTLTLMQTLGQPRLGLSAAEQQQMLGGYLPYALKVRVPAADNGTGDTPSGLALVQLAMAGRAHVLVSGDAELLALDGRLPCAVMALDPFLRLLQRLEIDPLPKARTVRAIPV